ncbi:ATP/GTP-binding protein [Spirosoma daeguense]
MKQTLLVAAAFISGASLLALTPPPVTSKPPKLVKVWETDTTLRTPESVLFDGRSTLYVANIDGKSDALDGNGFISKVSLDGKIENLRWTSGLNAPKGMGLYKNRLYVTDVYRLVCINTQNGQAEKTWDAVGQGAFLNDVTIDKEGTVYVSDNRNNKLYRLKDEKWEVFMEGEPLNNPNGVLAVGTDKLMVGNTKTGALCELDLKTKALKQLADGMANTDGIVPEGKGNYFVSDWNGRLFHIAADGTKSELLDTRTDKVNAADIEYVAKKKLLVVPTFLKNKLVAYKVE